MVDRRVAWDVGVEQQERHAADVDAPHAEGHVVPSERDANDDRRAVGPAHRAHGEALGVHLGPVLVLEAAQVEALMEVAAAVEEPQADQRHPKVGRLLQEIAGQDPEAARVHRQGLVDAELRREIGDRVLCAGAGRRRRRGRELGLQAGERRRRAPGEIRGPGALQQQGLGEQANGVPIAGGPALGVDVAKERLAIGLPGPPVVEGEAGEGSELGRHPGQQAIEGIGGG